jgi:hypothetical protein
MQRVVNRLRHAIMAHFFGLWYSEVYINLLLEHGQRLFQRLVGAMTCNPHNMNPATIPAILDIGALLPLVCVCVCVCVCVWLLLCVCSH